jgi:thiol:disulfide interchange protein DsbD
VFVDFTAAWCVTCEANEVAFLETDAVEEAARKHGVLCLRADWTRRDPDITSALAGFGRSSVPLYVVYSPHGGRAPTLLPPTITAGLVVDAFAAAADPAASIHRP